MWGTLVLISKLLMAGYKHGKIILQQPTLLLKIRQILWNGMTLTKRKDVDLQNVNFMKIHFTKANSIVCFYRKNVGIGILGRLYHRHRYIVRRVCIKIGYNWIFFLNSRSFIQRKISILFSAEFPCSQDKRAWFPKKYLLFSTLFLYTFSHIKFIGVCIKVTFT